MLIQKVLKFSFNYWKEFNKLIPSKRSERFQTLFKHLLIVNLPHHLSKPITPTPVYFYFTQKWSTSLFCPAISISLDSPILCLDLDLKFHMKWTWSTNLAKVENGSLGIKWRQFKKKKIFIYIFVEGFMSTEWTQKYSYTIRFIHIDPNATYSSYLCKEKGTVAFSWAGLVQMIMVNQAHRPET